MIQPDELHTARRRSFRLSATLAGAVLLAPLACGTHEPSELSATNQVTKAGWSFGFCLGPCRGDLTLSGAQLEYRISDRSGTQAIGANSGTLTATGRARLGALAIALGTTPLQEVYGCPDCADGGAAYLELQRDGARISTSYDFRRPPTPLAPLDAFLTEVMQALEACRATGSVEIAPGCRPLPQR